MDDTDGKCGIKIDEDDQVASSNSDYEYEGIFCHFFPSIWNFVMKYMFKML